MPTTTRSRTTQNSSSRVLERAPELEGLGLGIAPAADPPAVVSPELVGQAVDRAAGRRRVREALA